jgi:exodeoxyribonuclease VII small subunit
MSAPTPITFEDGYRRLQEIAEQVNEEEVPVDRMADLFAEGKGLEKALANHLAEQQARIEGIERGDEVHAFRIVPPGDAAPAGDDEPVEGDSSLSSPSTSGGASGRRRRPLLRIDGT